MTNNLKKLLVRFFKSTSKNKKLNTYLGFFLISFAFWFLSMLSQTHETTLKVPVKYTDYPTDLVIISSPVADLDVRVKARGFAILFYHLFNFNHLLLSYDVANSKPTDRGENLFWLMNSKRASVTKVIGVSMEIMNIEPENLDVDFSYRTKKEVPVILNKDIKLKKNYWLSENIKISPRIITVYGDQNILDSILHITTDLLSINDASKNTTTILNLQIPKGVDLNKEEVEVSIYLEQFIEEKISQKITINNLRSGYLIKLFPDEVIVTLRLPKDKYNLLKTDFFKAEVDLEDIDIGAKFLDVNINNLPSFIKIERIYPQQVEFLLIKD